MYQKSMFDCIQTFCRSKTLEKLLQKVLFSVPIMARKSTFIPANVLKTPLPVQRQQHEITFATVHITDDDSFL